MVQMVFMRFIRVHKSVGLHERNVKGCSQASGVKWTYHWNDYIILPVQVTKTIVQSLTGYNQFFCSYDVFMH